MCLFKTIFVIMIGSQFSLGDIAPKGKKTSTKDLRIGNHKFFNTDHSKSFIGTLVAYDQQSKVVQIRKKGTREPFSVALSKLSKVHHRSIIASFSAEKPRRFANNFFNQGGTKLCAGIASILATEQALGRKHNGLETVRKIAKMISPDHDPFKDGVATYFVLACYGLVYDNCELAERKSVPRYTLLDGIPVLKEALGKGGFAIVSERMRKEKKDEDGFRIGHVFSVAGYRKHPLQGDQFLVHNTRTAGVGSGEAWINQETLVEIANVDGSNQLRADIIDCSQRMTGNVPIPTPKKISLADSVHDAELAEKEFQKLEGFMKKQADDLLRLLAERGKPLEDSYEKNGLNIIEFYKKKSAEFFHTPSEIDGTSFVNIASYWGSEINEDSVTGLCDILDSNLLAQRKLLCSLNYRDRNKVDQIGFATLIGKDERGYIFGCENQKIGVRAEDLPSRLSYPVECPLHGKNRHLILAYPRDENGMGVVCRLK